MALPLMSERIFSLEEAKALLPRLRTILAEGADEWNRVKSLNPQIQKARDKAQFDGHSPYGVEYIETVTHLMLLLQQIRDLGIHLKDVERGLCDFPYMKDGKVVYLCWQLGEETIEYWHDIETGFAGREPLDDTDR
jgi:hypothetical protein